MHAFEAQHEIGPIDAGRGLKAGAKLAREHPLCDRQRGHRRETVAVWRVRSGTHTASKPVFHLCDNCARCRRALSFGDARYRTVKTILDNGLDQQLDIPETPETLSDAYTGKGRFTRDAKSLLQLKKENADEPHARTRTHA